MENQNEVQVNKFTLHSGKVILLREPTIGDTETVAQLSGKKAGDNLAYLGVLMQKELFKLLLVAMGEKDQEPKAISGNEKERLNTMFSLKEWKQCVKALTMVTGDEEEGNEQLTTEFTTFGNK